MAEASTEVPKDFRDLFNVDIGTHAGYVFESNSEKQERLFELCRELILRHCGVLYIAGKQGVKGIRLSLIDTGLDVSGYQRSGQMNIVDSEEWYLSSPRRIQFKSDAELENEFRRVSEETISSGYNYLVVISETDMLVRKGFLAKYAELDAQLDSVIRDLKIGFLCAFDRRELVASGVKDATLQVTVTHQTMI